jgi:hypothetical protein
MADASASERAEMIRRAGSRKTRRASFSPERPTKWHPTSLLHPEGGEPFTVDNCWAFIAAAIGAGTPVEAIELRKPQGKRGYVMKLQGHGGVVIYVKLQLLSDVVLGRSFHQSVVGQDEEE